MLAIKGPTIRSETDLAMMTWILTPQGPGSSTSFRARLLSALALMVAFAGCSGEPGAVVLPKAPVYPVKGSVVLADGKPLTEGTVTFSPTKIEARPAHGTIQSDGSFTLKTGEEEGAAEGEYIVSFASDQTIPGPKATTKSAVPYAFSDEGSSLKMTLKAGPNDLPPIKLVPGQAGSGGNRNE